MINELKNFVNIKNLVGFTYHLFKILSLYSKQLFILFLGKFNKKSKNQTFFLCQLFYINVFVILGNRRSQVLEQDDGKCINCI
jgi:hypothetical protein